MDDAGGEIDAVSAGAPDSSACALQATPQLTDLAITPGDTNVTVTPITATLTDPGC